MPPRDVTFLNRHSTFLVSPTSWDLHCSLGHHPHSFLNYPCSDLVPVTHCLPSDFPLKSMKPPHSCNSCILHVCKTSIEGRMPRSAVSLSSSLAPLDYGCSSLWMPWPENSDMNPGPKALSSQGKVFQKSLFFYTLRLGGIWLIPEILSKHFSIVLMHSTWLLLLFLWYWGLDSGPHV
jgi:hypothetical protein